MHVSLRVSGVDVDVLCPFCGVEEETTNHVVLRCAAVQPLWFASLLTLCVASFTSLHELVVAVLSSAEESVVATFQAWIYVLWEARNVVILDSNQVSMETLLSRFGALTELSEDASAQVMR